MGRKECGAYALKHTHTHAPANIDRIADVATNFRHLARQELKSLDLDEVPGGARCELFETTLDNRYDCNPIVRFEHKFLRHDCMYASGRARDGKREEKSE